MSSAKIERKDFGFLNLEVTKSDNEVRVWASSIGGINQFRLKATGKVHAATIADIVVTSKDNIISKIVKYLEQKLEDLPKDYEYQNLCSLAETILNDVKLIVENKRD